MSLFTAEELEELHRVSGCVDEEEPREVECLPTGVQTKEKSRSPDGSPGNSAKDMNVS